MKPLDMPTLSGFKSPSAKVKAASYEDSAECPDGHLFVIWRKLRTAGRVVNTSCPVCKTYFDAVAGPVPAHDKPMSVREAAIEQRLVKRVTALGGEVRKVKWVGRRGAPDRLVMLPSQTQTWTDYRACATTIWIELKAPGGAATFPKNAHERAQHREHERMRKMGQRVEIVDSYERIEEILA